ncbi:MAG: C/D box methylation guide ribonucleoprotein complex aNOP56 subunit [Fervidicoccaceae archaeon]
MGKLFLLHHVVGTFLLDERGEIVKGFLAVKDIDENVEQNLKLESGSDELPASLSRVFEELSADSTYVVETEQLARLLSRRGAAGVEVDRGAEPFRRFRERVADIAVELGFVRSREEYYEYMRAFLTELARRKLRAAARRRDLLAAQSIRAIDDLDKTFNLFATRLREWYGVHFPELDEHIPKHEQYIELVYELGHRENFTIEKLERLGVPRSKAEKIAEAARNSIAADLSDFDIEPIKVMAEIALTMYNLRQRLADYVEAVMREVAPNVTALVGGLLGARLISLAGSLEDLAKLPASTIQVLGAEKALFRALRTGTKPPKHGVIFQYPEIHRSPRWQRGKIARALAGKLSIAAKVDAFTGRLVGEKLVEDLKKRIEEIKRLYPKPPLKKEVAGPLPPKKEKEKKRETRRPRR